MNNFMGFLQILGLARQNPQQAVLNMLQQGVQSGRINQMQYNVLSSQIQNGANPNAIIQEMLNSGMVSQGQYESARQNARNFK